MKPNPNGPILTTAFADNEPLSFLGHQHGPMTLFSGSGKKCYQPRYVKKCGNQNCWFHKRGDSNIVKTKCGACGTPFCDDGCCKMSWEEKQHHFFFCKINCEKYALIKNLSGDEVLLFNESQFEEIENSKEYISKIKRLKNMYGLSDEDILKYKNLFTF